VCSTPVRTNGVAVVTQAALHTGAGNCSLPVTHASMATAATQGYPGARANAPINWVWVVVGGVVILVPLIAILASNGHGHGNLQPVSPPRGEPGVPAQTAASAAVFVCAQFAGAMRAKRGISTSNASPFSSTKRYDPDIEPLGVSSGQPDT